jgi:uncharacterized SAM-binding protein YcdF (DUF218 family)
MQTVTNGETISMFKRRVAKPLIAVAIVGAIAAFGMVRLGDHLVVNHPEQSDLIVVLSGDHNDLRYWRGLELLRGGYGHRMLVDAPADLSYGRSYAQYAADFVAQTAGEKRPQIGICTVTNDSTVQETYDVRRCLAEVNPAPKSVLLVTNDFHTRRALSIFRTRLPQYHWSSAAVSDTERFGEPWWRNREWAKVYVSESEKLVWWELCESWRK